MYQVNHRFYTLYFFITGVLFGLSGPLNYFVAGSNEAFYIRPIISLFALAGAAYCMVKKVDIETTAYFAYSMVLIILVHFLYFSWLNDFDYYYSCGLFQVVSLSLLIIIHKKYLLIYILLFNLPATALIFMNGTEPKNIVLTICLVLFSFIVAIYQYEKIKLYDSLSESVDKLKKSKEEIEKIYSNNLQAAHDLGSPVSALNIVADKIKYENPDLFRLLENSIGRINDISGNLLRSHGEVKKEVESDFFDLENNISKLIEDKRREFDGEKNLFIFYRITAPLVQEVRIPKTEFYRVLSNLVNNSVEAMRNKQEKRIKLVITPLDHSVELIVTDNGEGIPEDKQKEIFLENVSFKKGGTGLGLSYAKKTVENWGGSIQLIKSNPGGTSLRLTIPYA